MIDILVVGHAPILGVNRAIYRALAGLGWNIELAVPSRLPWPGPSVEPQSPEDPPIHFLEPAGAQTRFWRFEGLDGLLHSRRPRLVLLENEPDTRMAWELGGICKTLGAALVCQSNENDLPNPFLALGKGRWKAALRSVRSRVWASVTRHRIAHVFAICSEGVATMEALGFSGRVTQIPLGFDSEKFRPFDALERGRIRAELGLAEPTIAYCGRLMEIKGVHVLVEALAGLTGLSWQFLIDDVNEGQDAYVASLNARMQSSGIADRCVKFHASHAEMPKVMNAADVVVTPSIWKEQYGRVVPEAMACGRCVVVSEIGAMPELLGGCGETVPPGDVHALTSTIRRLLMDAPRREALGATAAVRARHELSLERQCRIMDRVLRLIADGQTAARPTARWAQ